MHRSLLPSIDLALFELLSVEQTRSSLAPKRTKDMDQVSLCISCFTTWSSWPPCQQGRSFNICNLLQARTLEEPSYSSEMSTLAT